MLEPGTHRPDTSWGPRQWGNGHLCNSQAGSQDSQGGSGGAPAQGIDLGDLLAQQVGDLCSSPLGVEACVAAELQQPVKIVWRLLVCVLPAVQ